MLKKIKEFKWGYIFLFTVLAAAGVCFLAFKDALSTLAIVIGSLIAAYGILLAVLTMANKSRGALFAIKIIISVAALVAGIVTVIFRDGAMEIISSLICLLLIVDGSFKLQTTALSKRYSVLAWWLMLIPSALSIAGGFIALRLSPSVANEEGLAAVSVIIGVTLIVDALANFLSAFYISRFESNMKEELECEIYAKIEARKAEEAEEAKLEAEEADASEEAEAESNAEAADADSAKADAPSRFSLFRKRKR